MRIVDLTLEIDSGIEGIPGMKVYEQNPTRLEALALPGEEQLAQYREEGRDIASDVMTGYLASVSRLTVTTHTGTHIDAPRHFFADKASIDRVPLETVVSKAFLLDLSHKGSNDVITSADLDEVSDGVGPDVIPVIYTGWTEKTWGRPEFYTEMPYCERGTGEWFLERGVKAVAVDCFNDLRPWSPPPDLKPDEPLTPLHNALLGRGVVLIENLTNLSQIRDKTFLLIALPLKLVGADGSTARVIAIEGLV